MTNHRSFKECLENNEKPFLVVSLLGSEKWPKSGKFLQTMKTPKKNSSDEMFITTTARFIG